MTRKIIKVHALEGLIEYVEDWINKEKQAQQEDREHCSLCDQSLHDHIETRIGVLNTVLRSIQNTAKTGPHIATQDWCWDMSTVPHNDRFEGLLIDEQEQLQVLSNCDLGISVSNYESDHYLTWIGHGGLKIIAWRSLPTLPTLPTGDKNV